MVATPSTLRWAVCILLFDSPLWRFAAHGWLPPQQWFVDHPECPTGCGCRCVEVSFAHNADTDDDQTLESVLSHEDLQILPMGSDDSAGRRFHGKQVRFS